MRSPKAVLASGLLAAIAWLPSLGLASEDKVDLTAGWKFAPGDGPNRADSDFDDSNWQPIAVDRVWEEQGHQKLDGFAWFRLRVALPSRLKQQAFIQDGLRLCLGKINNFDRTFLNGHIIGINAKDVPAETVPDETFLKADPQLWDVQRCFTVPPDDPRILWDRENVIAVRVFDEGGQGGIHAGDHYARMVALTDFVALDVPSRPFDLRGGEVAKTFTLANTSNLHPLRGTFVITAKNKLSQATIQQRQTPVDLPPLGKQEFALTLKGEDQAAAIHYQMDLADGRGHITNREESPYILTPPPPDRPRINGAAVYGARPGRPFLYTVAVSGRRPMTFAAEKLPAGLAIDSHTGIISGKIAARGTYDVTLIVRNAQGEDRRELKIVGGDRIALTPPMGWNGWNCWGLSVDQDKVLQAAKAFVERGLRDHGWTYVNIDDGWEIKGSSDQPKRSARGDIIVNQKFKDMRTPSDQIHALGLKIGIYSSPGPLTCGQYTGSYQHEDNDAASYALWGIDYLKYNWCSYDKIAKDQSLHELKKPYTVMRQSLDRADRDIVYSFYQYGMGEVWEWGDSVGGNLWRTTEDITDTWESMKTIGFGQVESALFAGPGRFNDPDILVLGWVGWGPSLHPTRLTPDEQYTHISLWSLFSSPLLIGADLERLDPFTLNLLTNDEVLAVDQDPLGRQATPVLKQEEVQVWVKDMADGSRAVGIFNLGDQSKRYTLELEAVGLPRNSALRDLWRQKDLGVFQQAFSAHLPSHGVILLRVRAAG